MATRNIPHRNSNDNQVRRAEALRIAGERLAAHNAHALSVTEIHFTSNPGPDFAPRPWMWPCKPHTHCTTPTTARF